MDRENDIAPGPLSATPLYAWVSFDGFCVLLPQPEVRVLEPILDVDTTNPPHQGIGWFTFTGKRWPVYCPTRELSLSLKLPAGRRVCAVLANSDAYLGFACDQVRILESSALRLYPVPKCMRQPGAPATALAVLEDQALMISTVPRLAGSLGIGTPSRAQCQGTEDKVA